MAWKITTALGIAVFGLGIPCSAHAGLLVGAQAVNDALLEITGPALSSNVTAVTTTYSQAVFNDYGPAPYNPAGGPIPAPVIGPFLDQASGSLTFPQVPPGTTPHFSTSYPTASLGPAGTPQGPGSLGFAFNSAGSPFNSQIEMNSVAWVAGCCGRAGTLNILDITFTEGPAASTLTFSFLDNISLITMTDLYTGAGAGVSNAFYVYDRTIGSTVLAYVPPDLNVGIGSCCGFDNTLTQTESLTFGTALAKGHSYSIRVILDPEVATTVFEPSSILLLGSGLMGLALLARRRDLRN